MPVGSLLTAKELASTYQSLLLATVTFMDGSVLRLSTHDITGTVTYGGNNYLPRIVNKEIAATQALGEQGIDVPASVNLRLSDPDFYLWSNFETLKGFKGAKLELRAVMFDVQTNDFSTDSRVIFRGTCREPGGRLPQHDGKILSIGFQSKLGMSDVFLPVIRVQRTCPWIFPSTAAERQDGADNSKSEFFRCGYSPDASGGNARGNYQSGTTPFTTCDFTKEDCVARGMFARDTLDRKTARFGAVAWSPKKTTKVREYISGKWADVQISSNEARYGDSVPMLWGTAKTEPLILNSVPDGNFLQFEVLICFGAVDDIEQVLVNDIPIPHTYNDTKMPIVTAGSIKNAAEASLGGWWGAVNNGSRDGAEPDAMFKDEFGAVVSDPYGSLCVLHIAVPRKVADAGSIPRVTVIARRGSGNPATQIREILQDWVAWDTAELATSTFDSAAAIADGFINYKDQFGNTVSHKRFISSLYLRQRESAADVILGLRNNMRALLAPDASGLLSLRVKQTIAAQQPGPVDGSNHNTAISGGYVAYKFDESNILEAPRASLIAAGNRYSFQFQNSENEWSWDAFSPIDSDDVRRSDREIPGSFTIRGANNYDQLYRLVATWSAEQLRGNSRGDTGGTLTFEFPISFRGVHLSLGDICLFNWEPLGVSNQLVRVLRISPATNFETARITVTRHDDAWYADTYGQKDQPRFVPGHRNQLLRPAFPWRPYGQQPVAGDSMFDVTDWGFGLAKIYEIAADGSALTKLRVTGRQIINVTPAGPNPPYVPLQGTTASTGGTIAGGRSYYVAIAAKNANDKLSLLSNITVIAVPSGTNTNTITVPNLSWDTGAVGYVVFAGIIPTALSQQAEATGTPTSITLTALNTAAWGAPDGEFDRYRLRVKRELHGGLWGAQVLAVTATTIQVAVASPGFSTNQWAGYDVTWMGNLDSIDSPLPIATFRVASNNADTLTLAGGAPNPVTLGLGVGDVLIMRAKPTFGTDATGTYLQDTNWQNVIHPDGLPVGEEEGYIIRFIAGTGRGQAVRCHGNTANKHYAEFPFTPDSTSRYIIEEPNWQVIQDTESINNDDPAAEMFTEVDVNNYVGQTLLVQVLTVDGGGSESIEALSPVREAYLMGSDGVRFV